MYDKFEQQKPFTLLDTSKYPPEVAGRFNSFITTQFDDSLSVEMQMRSIIKWAIDNFKEMDQTYNDFTEYVIEENLNPFIQFLNDLIEYMNYFIETFDEKYQETILDKMQEWYDNGELETLINDSLDTKYHEMDQRLTAQLAQTAINPDNYIGTDTERVQQAINEATLHDRGIILWRVYDITGGTLKLGPTKGKRFPLVFDAINKGGFRKDDAGFLFDSDLEMVSDYIFNNIYFRSEEGSGLRVFNADKILVVTTNGCIFRYVDTKVYTSDTGYVQSYRMNNDNVIGGSGAFFDIVGSYDLIINNGYYENREDVLVHRLVSGYINEYNIMNRLFVSKCIFQSVRHSLIIRGTRGCTLDGNYFEGNTSDITFIEDPLGFNYGVAITNNGDYGKTGEAMIKWGRKHTQAHSSNNFTQFIALHDTRDVEQGYINGVNDKSYLPNLDPNGRYFNSVPANYVPNGLKYGPFSKYKISSGNISFASDETKDIVLMFPVDLETDTQISIQTVLTIEAMNKFTINHYYRKWDAKKELVINVSNKNGETASASFTASVLMLSPNI